MNAAARTVDVTLTNRTKRKCYFRGAGPLMDYIVVVTTASGKRLLPAAPPNAGTTGRTACFASVWDVALGPKGEHTESLALESRVDIPKAGGTFRVRIGRGLFSM